MAPPDPNLRMLDEAVERLGPLAEAMVFVGGCATGLLITDPAAPPIRATYDVDAIVHVATKQDYHRLANQLRETGFNEDRSEDAHIARWRAGSLVLDIMPSEPGVLGFGNEWYRVAFDDASWFGLPSGRRVRVLSAPLFLATKLAAFDDRGAGDFLASHDLEDIVAVIDGRPGIVDELQWADRGLRGHVANRIRKLNADSAFQQALPGLLPGDTASQARIGLVRERLAELAGLVDPENQ